MTKALSGSLLELIFDFLLPRPWLIAILLIGSVGGIIIWVLIQMKESKESEEFHRKERAHGDSIWKD